MRSLLSASRPALTAALLLLLGPAGCGTRYYPVRGTVTLDDGTPLTKGLVVFESQGGEGEEVFMARGAIQPDGSYQLSTNYPGDGVPPGKYRVVIGSMDLTDLPDHKKNLPFDAKYLKFETSGLEYEVKPGPNEFAIRLDRPRRSGR
ncbi:MAG TPA: hypothetical protein VNK04_21395 [Gemmataceae bacterium]|nr:hypothetical protein [Gemmataceae bacterium]